MIRQHFNVEHYWEVIVYYNADYDLFHLIERDLVNTGISDYWLWKLYDMMSSYKAKAVTYSSLFLHRSIVIFNNHSSKTDYINSIVHEAEHVKQAMLKAYKVEDEGEPPAYTIGYLIGRMWKVFRIIVCDRCLG